jgi:phosphatidylserine/phosphatidylglycerophosphate/cardiolipin synthase-like enzyme
MHWLSRTAIPKTGKALRVPDNFGKTNFIIGMPSSYFTQRYRNDEPSENQQKNDQYGIHEAYFSPDDDLQQKLIDYIKHEQQGIKLAIFSFTDKEIADALIDAHKRGVTIEVVADAGLLADRFGKIACLQESGIKIYLYDPSQAHRDIKTLSHIMHNKFVLFQKNRENRPLIWTGSYNFTRSARLSNRENVVVLDNPGIITKFDRQFDGLKKETISYNPKKQVGLDIKSGCTKEQ